MAFNWWFFPFCLLDIVAYRIARKNGAEIVWWRAIPGSGYVLLAIAIIKVGR